MFPAGAAEAASGTARILAQTATAPRQAMRTRGGDHSGEIVRAAEIAVRYATAAQPALASAKSAGKNGATNAVTASTIHRRLSRVVWFSTVRSQLRAQQPAQSMCMHGETQCQRRRRRCAAPCIAGSLAATRPALRGRPLGQRRVRQHHLRKRAPSGQRYHGRDANPSPAPACEAPTRVASGILQAASNRSARRSRHRSVVSSGMASSSTDRPSCHRP